MYATSIPAQLMTGPFTASQAAAAGVSRGALYGPQFERVHRGVYVVRGTSLDMPRRVAAARLALPPDAYLSHITRIQHLGLDVGHHETLHFTIARDLHVTPRGVFLHRTKALPPVGPEGVTPATAFMNVSASMTMLELIVIGDWLAHCGHISTDEISALALRDRWRPGASQVLQVLPHLNERAASPAESRSRAYLEFAGLPTPLVNVPVFESPNSPIMDLWLPDWLLAIEHEGGHHFRDPEQIKRDTWRYAILRERRIEYLQVFDEMLRHPIAYVRRVHELLAARGYVGPGPDFGANWQSLGRRVRARPIAAKGGR